MKAWGGLLLVGTVLWAGLAMAAPAPAPTGVKEAFFLTRGPGYQLHVEEVVVFPAGLKGTVAVGLLRGFANLQMLQGQAYSVDQATSALVVENPGSQITVSYDLNGDNPSVALRLPAPGPIAVVQFLAGPDVYPVPITNNAITYASPSQGGISQVQGVAVTDWVAGNLPAGQDFTLGLTLGVPGAGAGQLVRYLAVILGLLGVVSVFWFRSRLKTMI